MNESVLGCTQARSTMNDQSESMNLLELLPREVLERIADMIWFDEMTVRVRRGKRGCLYWQEANYLYQLAQSDVMLTHKRLG